MASIETGTGQRGHDASVPGGSPGDADPAPGDVAVALSPVPAPPADWAPEAPTPGSPTAGAPTAGPPTSGSGRSDLEVRVRQVAREVVHTPFTRRTWSELLFVVLGSLLAFAGSVVVGLTMAVGLLLVITFVGFFVIGLSLRSARGVGRRTRSLARSLLGEHIEEPEPFANRHRGLLGWLQSALRDRTAWRSLAYLVLKVPLALFAVWAALSLWFDGVLWVLTGLAGGGGSRGIGLPAVVFHGAQSYGPLRFSDRLGYVVIGVLLLFAAPWAVRAVVVVDRALMRTLLSPDPTDARLRSLEAARTQTLDSSAATLRRIERDLHDGTQAQLVALAMRLGLAKEKLAEGDRFDLGAARGLVGEAHAGVKEIITELRDLTRGIHPPALDLGLEGALATLAARSTVPTESSVALVDRPTPAVEAIAYFCAAELLANVAQHAQASRASVSCTQDGAWLRLVVRDDGVGGAAPCATGSSSSGLPGLAERVDSVSGHMVLVSPPGGPTVVTVDLPLTP